MKKANSFDLMGYEFTVEEVHLNLPPKPATLCRQNFAVYEAGVSDEVKAAGPRANHYYTFNQLDFDGNSIGRRQTHRPKATNPPNH